MKMKLSLYLIKYHEINRSQDSSVGIATGYELGSEFESRLGKEFFLHVVQTGSGAHPSSYSIGTGGFFLGDKAAGA
jgi:hypothetical protein